MTKQHPHRSPVLAEGVLQHKGKIGFVLSEDPKVGDVLIQGPSLRLAMNGDRVRARVTSAPGELRRAGETRDLDVLKAVVHEMGLPALFAGALENIMFRLKLA